jgi:hypothetical protein
MRLGSAIAVQDSGALAGAPAVGKWRRLAWGPSLLGYLKETRDADDFCKARPLPFPSISAHRCPSMQ